MSHPSATLMFSRTKCLTSKWRPPTWFECQICVVLFKGVAYIGSGVGGWSTWAKKLEISWLHPKSMTYIRKIHYSRLLPCLPTVNPKLNLMWYFQVGHHLILVSKDTQLATVSHVRWPQSLVNITNNQEGCTMEGFQVLKQGEQQHTIRALAVLCKDLYVTRMW